MTIQVLLAGSTGLVGHRVGSGLAERSDIALTRLVRSGSSGSGQPIDFESLYSAPEATLRPVVPNGVDVAISCLGTTIRSAGSQAAMYRVDHDYVLALAQGARALGARQFILVSSVGAGGPGFYLRTKGATERDIIALGFARVDLIRPGMLLGDRARARPLERFGQRLAAGLAPLMVGKLSQYGVISAETVAGAIVRLTGQEGDGCRTYFNPQIMRIAHPQTCLVITP
ncbi:MAG: hypothetical protein ABF876_07250 [Acetobacter aceti]|uniref:NAD(P)-binding domain-containing protein n=1 Tax=Acetobacter aceti TaxID=435 RepID=A0A1U9KDG1_ACEAC|nr:hypothetical protein [Acetobacter aceti]AQS83769.1 hypothetical protein A0U92_02150 [Acetobacter aceti]